MKPTEIGALYQVVVSESLRVSEDFTQRDSKRLMKAMLQRTMEAQECT